MKKVDEVPLRQFQVSYELMDGIKHEFFKHVVKAETAPTVKHGWIHAGQLRMNVKRIVPGSLEVREVR
ncbi:hypothetical protein [Lactiplantibacillus mudanjiangensis]|uniref:Uncharacterized protein n=1 Tax=Lactiplantibacillus mudanjiangensis TaxID=1296538 RepID=A0A660E1H5_9LACO|nr:hypothetical protein [Lactiplantibacillus mudanjiangensis]VDG26006.1 hypothetical protein MUDAN_IGPPGNFN_03533 [Lactiplantibacillus mudanjiangensis]VDG27896.1 hypothetical protein MUDAN_MDHGFNIF_02713 [Lactiplantibacillus mudanjiangensis]